MFYTRKFSGKNEAGVILSESMKSNIVDMM